MNKMSIIHVGSEARKIVDELRQFSTYEFFCLDDVKDGLEHREYEEYAMDLVPQSFFDGVKASGTKELTLICSACPKAAMSLSVLAQFKNDFEITVLFIRMGSFLSNPNDLFFEKMEMGVFQEFARSGLFKEVLILDYELILGLYPEEDDVWSIISNNIHLKNFCEHKEPDFSYSNGINVPNYANLEETSRIGTIFLFNPENYGENVEQSYFLLDSATKLHYYVGTDMNAQKHLTKIKTNPRLERTDQIVTHKVYESGKNFAVGVVYSNEVNY